jgi:protein phosphatase
MTALGVLTGSASRTGRRKENQDTVRIEVLPDGRLLALLADGMGGYRGGAYASRRTTEVVSQRLAAGDSIESAVRAANDAIIEEARVPERAGMGTTLVGVIVDRGSYRVFNVGDSRAYHITVDGAEQVTEDHSFVAEATKLGRTDGVEAARSRWKNALTRSVGSDGPLEVDVFGPFAAEEPHIVVLCSDGVYKGTPDHVISSVVRAVPDVINGAQTLVDVAFRRGSDDNMSAVLVEFGNLTRTTEITLPVPLMDGGQQADEDLSKIPSPPSVPTLADATSRKISSISDLSRRPVSRLLIASAVCAVGLAAIAVSWWSLRRGVDQSNDKSVSVGKNAPASSTMADSTKKDTTTLQVTDQQEGSSSPTTDSASHAVNKSKNDPSTQPSKGSRPRD